MCNQNGDDSDDTQIDSTEEGDLVEHSSDKVACRLAGTESRDVAAVLLQVVGYLYGVELNCRVEVCEEDYQQEVSDGIADGGRACPYAVTVSGEACDGRRDGCDGLSEDDGENTAHIDLHGKVGALSAVHLTADYTLCVLYRDAALGVVYQNDEHDHGQCAEEHQERYPNGGGALCCAAYHLVNIGRESGNDACEQNDRNTVADAELGDLLTQPHN